MVLREIGGGGVVREWRRQVRKGNRKDEISSAEKQKKKKKRGIFVKWSIKGSFVRCQPRRARASDEYQRWQQKTVLQQIDEVNRKM